MSAANVTLHQVPGLLATSVLLLAGFGCASSSQSLGSAVAPEGVDLSGNWVFNEEESDDTSQLGQMMQGPVQGGEGGMPGGVSGGRPSGGAGGMPGGRGGMTGGRGGMSGGRGGMLGGSRMDPEKMRQTMQLAIDPKRRFSIEQADSSVSFVTAWQGPLEIRFAGSELKQEYDWGEVKTRAGWIGRGLVVEREITGGGTVSERYTRSTTTDQLFVVTRLEMGGMAREPIEFRRVYDPAERS